jgi:hypothetical protein
VSALTGYQPVFVEQLTHHPGDAVGVADVELFRVREISATRAEPGLAIEFPPCESTSQTLPQAVGTGSVAVPGGGTEGGCATTGLLRCKT